VSIKNRKEFTKEQIAEAINQTDTMGGAAKVLRVDWRTFRWNAEKWGLYHPKESCWNQKFDLDDILAGKHPQYSTAHLAKRLVKEGRKEHRCVECGLTAWRGKAISLELNHIDGDNSNHHLENLEFLCPNCHSQTDTFRNKRGKK